MVHPHTELRFINDVIGYGVVATRFIPKGTIVWIADDLDRIFTPEKIAGMDPLYQDILHKYCYRDNRGNYIFSWDLARYVNHSFRPNCISTAYDFDLAVRDIHPGDELTEDYGFLNVDEPFKPVPEKGSRRKAVMPDDLPKYYKRWEKLLVGAFKRFNKVEQPLMKLIKPEFRDKVEAVARGESEMDSILPYLYYNRNGSSG